MTYDYDITEALRNIDTVNDVAFLRNLLVLHYLMLDRKVAVRTERYRGITAFDNAISDAYNYGIATNVTNHCLILFLNASIAVNMYNTVADDLRNRFHDTTRNIPNCEALTLLATALAQPRTFLKIYRVRGHYVVIGTEGIDKDNVIAAILMLEHADNREFAARLQAKVQHIKEFQFTATEYEVINEYFDGFLATRNLVRFRDLLSTTILMPRDYNHDITIAKEKIEDLTRRLEEKLRALQELQVNQYYKDYKLGATGTDPMIETLEHLMTTRYKDILDIASDGTSLYMTVRGIMTCSSSMEDYLRGTDRTNHKLYGCLNIIQLLRDISQGNVRIYMYGTFKINARFQGDRPIEGFETHMPNTELRNVIKNTHIWPVNCMSAARSQMMKYVHSNDFTGFFEHMFYTVGSIHPMDGATMPGIVDDMKNKCTGNFKLDYRTADGWKTMTAEAYYALLQTTRDQAGTTGDGNITEPVEEF